MQAILEPMSKQYSVLVAEDHTLIREGIVSMLGMEDEFEVIAVADDGRAATLLANEHRPDIILTDLSMPNTNGTEAIKAIKRRNPEVRIVVLTIHSSEEYIRAALRAGADGYVLKDDSSDELLAALRSVAVGKTYLSPSICGNLVTDYLKGAEESETTLYSWEKLSHREREVLKLVAEGERNKDIANYLSLSEKTVEKHRSNLMKKLGLHSAAQLTAYAIRNGLIDNF